MSVIHYSARELAQFAACSVRCLDMPPPAADGLFALLGDVAIANAEAYQSRYGEACEAIAPEDIRAAAAEFQAARVEDIARPWNIAGNLPDWPVRRLLQAIQDRVNKWAAEISARLEREAEGAQAYQEAAPLPLASLDAIADYGRRNGFGRAIFAEYRCDRSESQSDYWGSITARRVLIGFGKGKRESFKQLRAAAGRFAPTVEFGPGKNQWTFFPAFGADLAWTANCRGCRKGEQVPSMWERCEKLVLTDAEAAEHLKSLPELGKYRMDGGDVPIVWTARRESVEHRENYSMGGGNYLGDGRHRTGWKVSSDPLEYVGGTNKVETAVDIGEG